MEIKLNLPRALVLSTIIHAGALTLFYNMHKPIKLRMQVSLANLASKGLAKGSEEESKSILGGKGSEKNLEERAKGIISEYKEGEGDLWHYVENTPLDYIGRQRHYERIFTQDIFPGLEYLSTQIPIEKTSIKLLTPKKEERNGKEKKQSKSRLSISQDKMQELLDSLMTVPKEEQLNVMRRDYLSKYNPNEGDLPRLMREFYRQNMVRALYPSNKQDLLVDRYEEQLNKKLLFEYAYEYLSKDQMSKVSVEMLFMLESTYMITLDTIQDTLLYKPEKNYDKDIKIETANMARKSLIERLGEDGLAEITDKIKEKREELLKKVVSIGNYRKNDALLLLAGLYLGQNKNKEAIEALKQINPNGDENFTFKEVYDNMPRPIEDYNLRQIRAEIMGREQDYFTFIDQRNRKFLWKK